ncbi:hypothetical protein B0H13DRAFT_1898211 [Mycena leptocephala]|nr:hypothetical protein B0H13DRAFT_1898211 [Mycena leptocephala]
MLVQNQDVQLRRPGFHFGAPTDGVAGPIEVNAELDSSARAMMRTVLMLNWVVQVRPSNSGLAISGEIDIRTAAASVLKHRRTRTEYPYGFIESGDEDTLNAGLDGSVALIAVLPVAKARKNQTRSGIT